ncbi:MAG TPA: DUF6328 family protein [Gaiellaceae bacterium]|nr:DUF6328 family protein [Gaiellaceae bacterium]
MDREETEKERTDRQLIELLTELRVALPGSQILFGFLLTVPFATRFGRVDRTERAALFVCLLLTAVGTALLMAPSVYHRLRWGRGGKGDVIQVAHRFFLAGSACLAAGIVVAVFLVGDVLFGIVAGIVAGCAVAATVALTWYAMPVMRSRMPAVRDRQ